MMDIPMGEVDRLPWTLCSECQKDCGRRTPHGHFCLEGPNLYDVWACVARTDSAASNGQPATPTPHIETSALERF